MPYNWKYAILRIIIYDRYCMSLEQQLITRIDELEQDKTNEDAPDDLSNMAAEKISWELAELDDMVSELGLDATQAEALRASFDRDLEKILWDTQNELVDLQKIIDDDIWNKSTPEEVQEIVDIVPGATLEGVMELLNLDYDINLWTILQLYKEDNSLHFSDFVDFFSHNISLIHPYEQQFPAAHRKDISDFLDAHSSLQNPDISEMIFQWFESFDDFKAFIENFSEEGLENYIFLKMKYPALGQEVVMRFIDFFPNTDLNAVKDQISDFQFSEVENYMNIFSWIVNPDKRPEFLFRDPAFPHFQAIIENELISQDEAFSYENLFLIARNLYVQWVEISEMTYEICYEELKNIDFHLWSEVKDMPLFEWRNIIFAAHEEDLQADVIVEHGHEGDTERFWKQVTIDAIRSQGGSLPEEQIFHPEEDQESLRQAKEGTLRAIETIPPPLTFIFDGHGSENGLFFSDGEYIDGNEQQVRLDDDSISISPQELALALKNRFNNWNMSQSDIIIIDACSSQSFIRNTYAALSEEFSLEEAYVNGEVQRVFPIMIGPSEFDQVSYSNWESEYGDHFLWDVLWLSSSEPSSVGTVIDKQFDLEDGNPSVFVPNQDTGDIHQIAENAFWDWGNSFA